MRSLVPVGSIVCIWSTSGTTVGPVGGAVSGTIDIVIGIYSSEDNPSKLVIILTNSLSSNSGIPQGKTSRKVFTNLRLAILSALFPLCVRL